MGYRVRNCITFSLATLMLFSIASCGRFQSTPQKTIQTEISPTSTVEEWNQTTKGETEFNPLTANEIPPDDILQEISFYGAGGGELCWQSEQPVISYEPLDGELMTLSTMIACGWQKGEVLQGTIRYPDGGAITKEIPVFANDFGVHYAMLDFRPAIDDPPGSYTFLLEGKNGMVEASANFTEPDGPRLYRLDTEHLFVFGYAPNESIKLFHYNEQGKFAGWQAYQVDANGTLSIKISVNTHPYLTYFFVIGEQSGEARLLQEDYFGKTMDRIRQISIKEPGCAEFPSRLSSGDQARVAFTDGADMRIRELPGLAQTVLYKVPEGTELTVLEGPKCVDSILWWNVRTEKGNEGWMAEYQENTYLLEPLP